MESRKPLAITEIIDALSSPLILESMVMAKLPGVMPLSGSTLSQDESTLTVQLRTVVLSLLVTWISKLVPPESGASHSVSDKHKLRVSPGSVDLSQAEKNKEISSIKQYTKQVFTLSNADILPLIDIYDYKNIA
jgi:hypothetical protein